MTTGGFDTHSAQNVNAANGAVLQPDGDAERRRCSPSTTTCKNQGLLEDTLVLTFSEFGRRISENGSQGTDHGAGVGDDGDGRPGQRRPLRHGAAT